MTFRLYESYRKKLTSINRAGSFFITYWVLGRSYRTSQPEPMALPHHYNFKWDDSSNDTKLNKWNGMFIADPEEVQLRDTFTLHTHTHTLWRLFLVHWSIKDHHQTWVGATHKKWTGVGILPIFIGGRTYIYIQRYVPCVLAAIRSCSHTTLYIYFRLKPLHRLITFSLTPGLQMCKFVIYIQLRMFVWKNIA
jgi:hypothetical protein